MAAALQVGRAPDNEAYITDRVSAIPEKHAQEGLFRVTVLGWREFLAIAGRAGRLGSDRGQMPRALEISPRVAFSTSLTGFPPPNQPPPSASAVF